MKAAEAAAAAAKVEAVKVCLNRDPPCQGSSNSAHIQAAREKARLEEAAREKARLEEAAREKARLEEVAREKARLEEVAREKARLEEVAREKARLEEAVREKARLEEEAREKVTWGLCIFFWKICEAFYRCFEIWLTPHVIFTHAVTATTLSGVGARRRVARQGVGHQAGGADECVLRHA